jgi:twitching motility protein PilT
VQTINRVVDVFPAHQQQQIRTQLSFTLQGGLSQQLPAAQRPGADRMLAAEIMIANEAIRALIRDDKAHQIYSHHPDRWQASGMRTMNQSLVELYRHGAITHEDALSRSTDKDDLLRST